MIFGSSDNTGGNNAGSNGGNNTGGNNGGSNGGTNTGTSFPFEKGDMIKYSVEMTVRDENKVELGDLPANTPVEFIQKVGTRLKVKVKNSKGETEQRYIFYGTDSGIDYTKKVEKCNGEEIGKYQEIEKTGSTGAGNAADNKNNAGTNNKVESEQHFTLTYNYNGGQDSLGQFSGISVDGGNDNKYDLSEGDVIVIKDKETGESKWVKIKLDNHTFKGWASDEELAKRGITDITEDHCGDGDPWLVLKEPTTIWAVWEKQAKLIMDFDEGTNKSNEKSEIRYYDKGEKVILNEQNITKPGFKLVGWRVAGTEKQYENFGQDGCSFEIEEDTTLIAIWEKDENYKEPITLPENNVSDNMFMSIVEILIKGIIEMIKEMLPVMGEMMSNLF